MSDDEEYSEYTVLRELIELYKNQPCLWDSKNPNYRCSQSKNLAWTLMLSKYREIDPDAEITEVKKRINQMKAGYQKELRKVNRSILVSKRKEDIHVPLLWYYNLLSFLNKNELPKNHLIDSAVSDQRAEERNDDVYMLIVNDDLKPNRKIKLVGKRTPVKKTVSDIPHYKDDDHQNEELILPDTGDELDEYDIDENDSLMMQYRQKLQKSIRNTPKGDAETARLLNISPFAVYVGKQLEEMSMHQRILAEKIIAEVIFLGKTENLDYHSRIETKDPMPNVEKKPKSIKRSMKRDNSPDYTPNVTKVAKNETSCKRPKRKAAQKVKFVDSDGNNSVEELNDENPLSDTDYSSDEDSLVYEVPIESNRVDFNDKVNYDDSVDNDNDSVYTEIERIDDETDASISDNDERSSVNKGSVLRTLLLT